MPTQNLDMSFQSNVRALQPGYTDISVTDTLEIHDINSPAGKMAIASQIELLITPIFRHESIGAHSEVLWYAPADTAIIRKPAMPLVTDIEEDGTDFQNAETATSIIHLDINKGIKIELREQDILALGQAYADGDGTTYTAILSSISTSVAVVRLAYLDCVMIQELIDNTPATQVIEQDTRTAPAFDDVMKFKTGLASALVAPLEGAISRFYIGLPSNQIINIMTDIKTYLNMAFSTSTGITAENTTAQATGRLPYAEFNGARIYKQVLLGQLLDGTNADPKKRYITNFATFDFTDIEAIAYTRYTVAIVYNFNKTAIKEHPFTFKLLHQNEFKFGKGPIFEELCYIVKFPSGEALKKPVFHSTPKGKDFELKYTKSNRLLKSEKPDIIRATDDGAKAHYVKGEDFIKKGEKLLQIQADKNQDLIKGLIDELVKEKAKNYVAPAEPQTEEKTENEETNK